MENYQVTKELKFETEIKKGFSVRDLFTVFLPMVVAYYFAELFAHPAYLWWIVGAVGVAALYATTKARSGNPDKRRYEAIMFYLQSDKGTYLAPENPSKEQKAKDLTASLKEDKTYGQI